MTKDIVFTCDCMAFKATSDCAAVSAAAVSLTLGAAAWGEPLPAGSGFGSASSDFALSTRRPAGGFFTVNPIKLETGIRPNSAEIPYTLLLRIEAIGFPTFGLLL